MAKSLKQTYINTGILSLGVALIIELFLGSFYKLNFLFTAAGLFLIYMGLFWKDFDKYE